MEGVGWIGAIVIGGLAGWVAEKVTRARMGLIGNILVGIAGAVLLNFALIRFTGSTYVGLLGQLLVAAVGAIILIWLWRLVMGRGPN